MRTETLVLLAVVGFAWYSSQQKATAAAPPAAPPPPPRPSDDLFTVAANGLGQFLGGFFGNSVPKNT